MDKENRVKMGKNRGKGLKGILGTILCMALLPIAVMAVIDIVCHFH